MCLLGSEPWGDCLLNCSTQSASELPDGTEAAGPACRDSRGRPERLNWHQLEGKRLEKLFVAHPLVPDHPFGDIWFLNGFGGWRQRRCLEQREGLSTVRWKDTDVSFGAEATPSRKRQVLSIQVSFLGTFGLRRCPLALSRPSVGSDAGCHSRCGKGADSVSDPGSCTSWHWQTHGPAWDGAEVSDPLVLHGRIPQISRFSKEINSEPLLPKSLLQSPQNASPPPPPRQPLFSATS